MATINEMRVLSREGDVKTIWNPEVPQEVEAARQQFNRLVKNGQYLAYRVGEVGSMGEQIREFDPQAGSIILAPRLVGG